MDQEDLRRFIDEHAEANDCDYCGRESADAIACPFDDFASAFADGIAVDWDDALDFMPRDGGDWAFPEAHKDIWDVLDDLGVDMHAALRDDLIERFGDVSYAPRYYFGYSPEERLGYSWQGFVDYVSHESRFLFLAAGGDDLDDDLLRASQMLSELGRAIDEIGLVEPLPEGTRLYRARLHRRTDRLTTASDLGTAPRDAARTSSRMSPLGIALFYAAFEADTAVAETTAGGWPWRQNLTLATFEVTAGFNIVNFVDLPQVPSVFDEQRRHLIGPLRFIRQFVRDLREPIRRDEREHLEYIPTQIVCEYLRHLYERDTGEAVHGVAYRSAIAPTGTNVVLFARHSDCVEVLPPDAVRKLRLVTHRRVSRFSRTGHLMERRST